MKRWTIEKEFHFDAGHHLPLLPEGHKCRRPHGHSYVLVVGLESDELVDGMLLDYADMAAVVSPLVNDADKVEGVPCLDHVVLNDVEGLENPTTERLAEWFADRLMETLLRPFLSTVTVYESATTRCIYRVPKMGAK